MNTNQIKEFLRKAMNDFNKYLVTVDANRIIVGDPTEWKVVLTKDGNQYTLQFTVKTDDDAWQTNAELPFSNQTQEGQSIEMVFTTLGHYYSVDSHETVVAYEKLKSDPIEYDILKAHSNKLISDAYNNRL